MCLLEVKKQIHPLEDCNFHFNSVPFPHLCYLQGLLPRVATSWGRYTHQKALQCSQTIKKECTKSVSLKEGVGDMYMSA